MFLSRSYLYLANAGEHVAKASHMHVRPVASTPRISLSVREQDRMVGRNRYPERRVYHKPLCNERMSSIPFPLWDVTVGPERISRHLYCISFIQLCMYGLNVDSTHRGYQTLFPYRVVENGI